MRGMVFVVARDTHFLGWSQNDRFLFTSFLGLGMERTRSMACFALNIFQTFRLANGGTAGFAISGDVATHALGIERFIVLLQGLPCQ